MRTLLDLERIIVNRHINDGYIANIYVREKSRSGKYFLGKNSLAADGKNVVTVDNVELVVNDKDKKVATVTDQETPTEDYMKTFSEVLEKFRKKQVLKAWNGHNSFRYLFKGNFTKFKEYISAYNKIRNATENNGNALFRIVSHSLKV